MSIVNNRRAKISLQQQGIQINDTISQNLANEQEITTSGENSLKATKANNDLLSCLMAHAKPSVNVPNPSTPSSSDQEVKANKIKSLLIKKEPIYSHDNNSQKRDSSQVFDFINENEHIKRKRSLSSSSSTSSSSLSSTSSSSSLSLSSSSSSASTSSFASSYTEAKRVKFKNEMLSQDVPKFTGSDSPIESYIKNAKLYLSQFPNVCKKKKVSLLKVGISGEARGVLRIAGNRINSPRKLFKILKKMFKFERVAIKQKHGENVRDFGARIHKILREMNLSDRSLNKYCLKHFVEGVRGDLSGQLILKGFKKFKHAVHYASGLETSKIIEINTIYNQDNSDSNDIQTNMNELRKDYEKAKRQVIKLESYLTSSSQQNNLNEIYQNNESITKDNKSDAQSKSKISSIHGYFKASKSDQVPFRYHWSNRQTKNYDIVISRPNLTNYKASNNFKMEPLGFKTVS